VCRTIAAPRPHSALGVILIHCAFCQTVAATTTAIPVHGRWPNGVTKARSSSTRRAARALSSSRAKRANVIVSKAAKPPAVTMARARACSTDRYLITIVQMTSGGITLAVSSMKPIQR
jgi:hypothetical protein